MKSGKYYAVLASNGVFVHHNYNRAMICRDRYFMAPCTIIKYLSDEMALEAAREHLFDLAGKTRVIPNHLEINEFYIVRRLPRIETNQEKEDQ